LDDATDILAARKAGDHGSLIHVFKHFQLGSPLRTLLPAAIFSQPRSVPSFVNCTRRERQHCQGSILLAGNEVEAIKFQEKYPDYETGSLVSIEEWRVADDPRCI
jgi:hypothetical protein